MIGGENVSWEKCFLGKMFPGEDVLTHR